MTAGLTEAESLAAVRLLSVQVESLACGAGCPAPGAASYALPPFLDPRQAFASLATALESLCAQLQPEALIRTATPEGAVAQTALTYTGRALTAVPKNLSPALAQIHLLSLAHAYALRSAAVRALFAAAGAATAIAATAANPLLLPHAVCTALALKDALERLAAAVQAAI